MIEGDPCKDTKDRILYFLENATKRIMPIYPDIIVHHRGTMENNKFVIEAKKSSNDNKTAKNFDIVKLYAMTHQLNYDFGYYVEFSTGEKLKTYCSMNCYNSCYKYCSKHKCFNDFLDVDIYKICDKVYKVDIKTK